MGKRKRISETFHDSDEDINEEIEQEEEESSLIDQDQLNKEVKLLDPIVVGGFSDLIDQLIKSNTLDDFKASQLAKKDFSNHSQIKSYLEKHNIDPKIATQNLSAYFNHSFSKGKIKMSWAIEMIIDYINKGESVTMKSNYPKNPKSVFNVYLEENNILFTKATKADRAEFNKNRHIYEEKMKELYKEYVEKLEDYINENDLNSYETHFVKKKIEYFKKKYQPTETPKKKPKKEVEPQKTAYDFFKLSKIQLYEGLDPAEADAKLRKKFRKLPQELREVFEAMEANAKR